MHLYLFNLVATKFCVTTDIGLVMSTVRILERYFVQEKHTKKCQSTHHLFINAYLSQEIASPLYDLNSTLPAAKICDLVFPPGFRSSRPSSLDAAGHKILNSFPVSLFYVLNLSNISLVDFEVVP
jgi:hypothetical protein